MKKTKRISSFVIFALLIALAVAYADIEINPNQLYLSGNIGNTVIASFNVKNLGSSSLANLVFNSGQGLSSPNKMLSSSFIILNSGNSLNLLPGETKNVEVRIFTNSSLLTGNYLGLVTVNGTNIPVLLDLRISDSSAPLIIESSPIGKIVGSSTLLYAKTNEKASCRFEKNSGISYNSMAYSFDSLDGLIHTRPVLELIDGANKYHVRCKDENGNLMNSDYVISFSVDLPPSASISLSDASPLKAGLIKITLTTSEKVKQATLTYLYDGASETNIPLTGKDSSWTGYMIINEDVGNKIGFFKFSARDLNDNIGTQVDNNALFIIDTIKPEQIKSIKASSYEEDNLKLQWYYEADVDHFNVYRSEDPGLDYIDFYEDTKETTIIDSGLDGGKTYYYRVAAVDEAGNVALLSNEVSATPIMGDSQTTEESTKGLKVEYWGDVDRKIASIDKIADDANAININDPLGLELKQKVNSGVAELNSIRQETQALKEQDLTRIELDKKLDRLDLRIKVAKKSIPDSYTKLGEAEFAQVLNREDLVYLLGLIEKVGSQEKETYIDDNEDLINKYSVQSKAISFSIGYMDGSQEEKTLVEKKISSFEEDVSLVEVIPKEIAENTDEIQFLTDGANILQSDPVVEFPKSGSVRYIINKNIDVNQVKIIKTIALLKVAEKSADVSNKVTGFASLSKLARSGYSAIAIGIIAIIGLGVYYFFIMRTSNVKNEFDAKLDKLNLLLDGGNLENARIEYKLVYSSFMSTKFSDDRQKLETYNKIKSIYAKLNLPLKKNNSVGVR